MPDRKGRAAGRPTPTLPTEAFDADGLITSTDEPPPPEPSGAAFSPVEIDAEPAGADPGAAEPAPLDPPIDDAEWFSVVAATAGESAPARPTPDRGR